MLTQLNGENDIIALSVGGRIEKDEMELAFRLLDEAFARDGKVHIFVEVVKRRANGTPYRRRRGTPFRD